MWVWVRTTPRCGSVILFLATCRLILWFRAGIIGPWSIGVCVGVLCIITRCRCWFALLGVTWNFGYISHEEDSLSVSDAPYKVAAESLHSHKKGLSPIPLLIKPNNNP